MEGGTSSSSLFAPVVASLVAGGGTAVGGAIVFLLEGVPSDVSISFVLALAAGVMIAVTLLDLLGPAAFAGGVTSFLSALLCGGIGWIIANSISKIKVPDPEEVALNVFRSSSSSNSGSTSGSTSGNTSDSVTGASLNDDDDNGESGLRNMSNNNNTATAARRRHTWRLAVLLCGVLSFHNFPEGIAVGLGVEKSPKLGGVLALSIWLHNIAEGFVVAVPLLAATNDRKFAFLITALSGLTEPVGAIFGVATLRFFFGGADSESSSSGSSSGSGSDGNTHGANQFVTVERVLTAVLCVVGGIMIQVSVCELLPQAVKSGGNKTVVFGFLCGAGLITALTLIMH